ncbi:MAG: hypothetical protein ACI8RZ_000893 [Myxococcota bacterium]|jgi:hypothetical protein
MFILLTLACFDANPCDDGTIRSGDDCVGYVADEPVQGAPMLLPNGLTWQWQITEAVDTSHDVAVYDVDLFQLTDAVRDTLLSDDRILICYFSAGSFEPWTDDAGEFPDEVIGRPLDGWPDERWLDHTDPRVRDLMEARLDLAVERGCHGVEPDNVTAHTSNSGFGINPTEQLDYNRFLADAAHERDLSVALKNDVEQIPQLVDWFDFTVNEECADYDECSTLRPFVEADKAVLHTEYVDDWADAQDKADEVCGVEAGLSTLIKTWDLGPELLACP